MPNTWEQNILLGDRKKIYIFINDDNKQYYRANQNPDGSYSIVTSVDPYPVINNPINLLSSKLEFATTRKYFSMNRSISFPLEFIKDGAAILRHLYYNGRGKEQNAYITVLEYNPNNGQYDSSYRGKIEFKEKEEEPKTGKFIVPTKDDSAWGILSENDEVEVAVDCTKRNPKAIPVLFDGITLINKYTFQTVASGTSANNNQGSFTLPFLLVNQDGDSAGIITKNQSMIRGAREATEYLNTTEGFFETLYSVTPNIYGTYSFLFTAIAYNHDGSVHSDTAEVDVYFMTDQNVRYYIFQDLLVEDGNRYSAPINFDIPLSSGGKIFLMFTWHDMPTTFGTAYNFSTFTSDITNIFISTKTISQPIVAYGLRPLDFLQEIVKKATNGRASINSDFFIINNKSILFSGDSIRQIANAKLYSSFSDFFESFDAINFLSLRDILGQLWIEKATDVYNPSTASVINLGEVIDIKLLASTEYDANEIEIGSPKKDYRHPSGRLEFNSTNTFSMDVKSVKKKLSKVSKYLLGCYDIQFLIMDYIGSSTQDNSGDKSVYVADILDTMGTATLQVETFENVNVDNVLLQPIIKSPLSGDVLTYASPFIKGVASPSTFVNIYVDNVFNGSATSNSNGDWTYQIVGNLSEYIYQVRSGVHIIEATFGDNGDPKSSISVTIDLSFTTPLSITYPDATQNLYNNAPLIRGLGQAGTAITITINGSVATTTNIDNSGKWEYKTNNLPNGVNTLQVNTVSFSFNVNNVVAHPLITYIGSELDGFTLINNLPLIIGVAKPGEVVTLWLNYITYQSLGTVTADSNGNWSFQVVPVTYIDPLSHALVVLAPLRNGLNVISTSLTNYTVPITVSGYKLNRPPFDVITGVIDNTVFNTNYSPKMMLKNHYPLLSAIGNKDPNFRIYFQTADKNGNLSRSIGGVTTTENTDVLKTELGTPIALLEKVRLTTVAQKSFIKTLEDFNNGAIIRAQYRGHWLDLLPIGNMKMNSIVDTVQEWELLLGPFNSYQTLLDLFSNGIKITLMANQIYHSYNNSLHMVAYDYQRNPKYNFSEINQDWFENRNEAWSRNPTYIQKYQKSEVIIDQIITNGISSVILYMYRCDDAVLETSFNYNVVSVPVPAGHAVLEAIIDFSLFPENQYFFVLAVSGTPIMISERIYLKTFWQNTFLIAASNSINQIGAYFSTGFKTIIRVEGLIKKIQPDLTKVSSRDNEGNANLLYGIVSRKREVRFGTAYGLPDYLYLKIAECLASDQLEIEGVNYVLKDGSSLQQSDDIDGHPLYYYTVELDLKDNKKGATFEGIAQTTPGGGVVIVVNGAAFGGEAGSLINIELTP